MRERKRETEIEKARERRGESAATLYLTLTNLFISLKKSLKSHMETILSNENLRAKIVYIFIVFL